MAFDAQRGCSHRLKDNKQKRPTKLMFINQNIANLKISRIKENAMGEIGDCPIC